jgi:hypothetical protein
MPDTRFPECLAYLETNKQMGAQLLEQSLLFIYILSTKFCHNGIISDRIVMRV